MKCLETLHLVMFLALGHVELHVTQQINTNTRLIETNQHCNIVS